MEDLQLWVYIVFGIIYVVSRALKKKQPSKPGHSPLETEDEVSGRPTRRQPASFEELLREITAQNEPKEVEEEVVTVEEVSKSTSEPKQDFSLEGEKRHFSDDESRKIYERSIAAASNSDQEDISNTIPKVRLQKQESATSSSFSSDIKDMLANPTSARKAVILSEIFQRKY